MVAASALGEQAAVAGGCGAALTNESGDVGVRDFDVVESGYEEADAAVRGVAREEGAAHLGAGAVGADDEVGLAGGIVGVVKLPGRIRRAGGSPNGAF